MAEGETETKTRRISKVDQNENDCYNGRQNVHRDTLLYLVP
jgi:hypothetical protein